MNAAAPDPAATPDAGWHALPDEPPPAHVLLQVRLGDGSDAFAYWEPAHHRWATGPEPIPAGEVVAWRRAPHFR